MNINTNTSNFSLTQQLDQQTQGGDALDQTQELFSDYAKTHETQTPETNVLIIEAGNIEASNQDKLLTTSHPQENYVEGDFIFAPPDPHLSTPQFQGESIITNQLGSPPTSTNEIKTPIVTEIRSDTTLTQQTSEHINNVTTGQISSNTEDIILPRHLVTEAGATELSSTQAKFVYPLEGIDTLDVVQRASSTDRIVQPNGLTTELVAIKDSKTTVDTGTVQNVEASNNGLASAPSFGVDIKPDLVSVTPKIVGESVTPLTTITTPVADTLIRGPQTANVTTSLPTSHPAIQTVAQNLIKVQETQSGISVRLDPPEMGRVFIDFQFETNKGVTATIRSDIAETAVILKDKADFFQQMLKDNGFDAVTLNFEQNNASKQNRSDQFDGESNFSLSEIELDETIAANLPAASLYKLSPETAIDIKL